jgi:hypothetical protein
MQKMMKSKGKMKEMMKQMGGLGGGSMGGLGGLMGGGKSKALPDMNDLGGLEDLLGGKGKGGPKFPR